MPQESDSLELVEKRSETITASAPNNAATGTGGGGTNPLTKAGGAYIPPARLRMMQQQIQDKNSEAYQRMNWERLKRKIHGQVNRVNVANIVDVARALLQENLIRGRFRIYSRYLNQIIGTRILQGTFCSFHYTSPSIFTIIFPRVFRSCCHH
jgi:hypothetical protein